MKSQQLTYASLAFIFNTELTHVLLIEKEKPVHHQGLLNGLGGKQEGIESELDCVSREIFEEAGLVITKDNWYKIGFMSWIHWRVTIWTGVYNNMELAPEYKKNKVAWYPVDSLPTNIISNLRWLIPLAIDVHEQVQNQEFSPSLVEITYM